MIDFPGLALLLLTSGYALMILWFTLPLFRKRARPISGGETPFITIIVATRNEEQNIHRCLLDLIAQDFPADRFEVIVSDDHSTDSTMAEAETTALQNPGIRMKIIGASSLDGSGKKQAILRAIKAARGEAILTTDADTRHGPGWLRAMAECYGPPATRMVLGPVSLEGRTLFQRLQSLEFMGVMGMTAGSALSRNPLMCNGANFMYEKKSFGETGGFTGSIHYASGDDQFLLAAFQKRYGGRSIAFSFRREAIVSTFAEPTLRGFIDQRMRWVSKSKGYRDPSVILAGILTYLVQTSLLAGFIAGFFFPSILTVLLGCWVLKMTAELPMVVRMALFFGKGKDLWLYVPAQFLQMVYVPFTGLAGLLLPYRWKGRVIRT